MLTFKWLIYLVFELHLSKAIITVLKVNEERTNAYNQSERSKALVPALPLCEEVHDLGKDPPLPSNSEKEGYDRSCFTSVLGRIFSHS